jgi:hypothetical protein
MQSFVGQVMQRSRSRVRKPATEPIAPTVPISELSGQM